MLRFLPDHVRSVCRASTAPISLPHVEEDEDGVVAVIDISGFTQLSTRLLREHGSDGAARLLEAVNSPFEKIIRRVYASSSSAAAIATLSSERAPRGSIVKFAGDSALVCWTKTTRGRRRHGGKDDDDDNGDDGDEGGDGGDRRPGLRHVLESFLCGLELLQAFRSASGGLFCARDSIGIHIGVGFGRVSHIYLGGAAAATEPQGDALAVGFRREYIVAGAAVSQAARTLELGIRGQMAMSGEYRGALCEALSGLALTTQTDIKLGGPPPRQRLLERISETGAGGAMSNLVIDEDEVPSPEALDRFRLLIESSGVNHSNGQEQAADDDEYFDLARMLQFIESSVARYLMEDEGGEGSHALSPQPHTAPTRLKPGTLPSLQLPPRLRPLNWRRQLVDNYSDLRTVAVAFFRFPGIDVSGALRLRKGEVASAVLSAQRATDAVIACIAENDGSLRQINFDDKAFTALAVWGLRGSAHQRSEAAYAVQACLGFAERVRSWDKGGGEMDSNHAIGDVSIGVAFGSVYAGLLGNELRMDGTVLGAAVNLAARLMCLDQPTANEDHVGGEGGGVWAYCDVATYEACQDRFKFGEASRVVKLKGFHQSITVYNLVGEKVSGIVARNSVVRHDLFGRVEEVALLKRVIQKWKQGEPRQSILISGRSGLGKSALTHQALRQLRGDTSAIICSCVAQEMKRQSSFWLLGSFLRTLISQLQSAGIEPSPIERGCSASEVSATSNRRHSIASSALTGPLCRRSEMHATGTANSGTVGSIFTTSGADRASTFLIEAVTRIERGALPALAIVPGFRFAAETSRPTADCTLTLSSVVAQLLAAAEKLSSRILIVLDDTQWIDRESLRVFGMLMQLCPLILFVMVARPREEWDHRDDFDTIKTRCEHLITLSPLSSDALHALVAQELGRANAKEGIIGEIAEWSNGIPMAVHLALSMIKSHNSGGPLEQANLLKSQTLKKLDSSQARLETAVTAQLDSLSAAFRQVLLVASVIGQYFSLNTLSCVLQDVEMPSEPDDFSVSQITHLIKTEDRYGFLAGVSDDEDSCSFSHYLIFRGVLASLLPQKREKIRRVLTFHLISRLNEDDDDGLLLPNIIEQLLQLDGEKSLKANYLFRGFVAAAEARKSAEAFYYKRLLDDLDRDYCTTLPLTVRMRDCRLRAILHYQNGEADKAVAAAAELFNLTSASFKVRSNTTLGFLISLYRHLRVLSSIQQSPSAGEIASRYLLETFPFAFPAPEKGAEPKKGRSRKTVHPLHDASSMKDALERLGEIVLVLDMLCEMFIVGEREGPDLILYQMSLVVLASFGKFASTGTDQRYWSWRLRLGWSGLGMSWYLIGRSSQGKRCIDAALASIPLENADSESPPLTPLELLCKGTCCTIESALDRMRNETICMSAVLMLRAACDHYRAAGAEFEVACKGSQLTLQWMLVMMGSFSLPTEHGDLYRMDEVLKRAEKYSFDGRYVMQLKSAVAFETSMRGDFSRAEEYVRLCSVAGFNLIEDLGLEEVNVLTVLAIMVNVTCLSMLLVERGRVLSISVGVFNRFVDSYDTAQAATAPTLKSLLIQGTVLCAIVTIGTGLSFFEPSPPQKTLLTEAKKGLLAFIVSCRKFAASCSPRSFQTTCCKGLAGVASQVLRGDLSRAEMALARLLGTAGAQDMIPAHMRLMLEARLVRLRYIRAARGETGLTVASVAAAAKELCARFQSFDNRCDPERLQAVCV